MRIVALTFGTEGDSRPMIALCRGLRDSGHDVTLLAERTAHGGGRLRAGGLREALRVEQMEIGRQIGVEGLGGKTAAVQMGAGAGLLAAGGLLTTLMAVHLLHRSTGLPLWACYGLVGGTLGAAGAGLLTAGARQAGRVNLVPEQSAAALKDNLAWIKQQVT